MLILTPEQVARIYEITDSFRLHRNWVVVPLAAPDSGVERVLPDGKLLVRAPGGASFDAWIAGLRRRLDRLDLSRTPKAGEHQPVKVRVEADAPPGSGSRRYLDWKK